VLESFLDSEFSSENLRFWMSIQDLKYSANSQIETKAQLILDEYLAAGSPCQVFLKLILKVEKHFLKVNVDSRTLDETLKCINESHTSRRFAFSLAEEHVFTLMSKDSYPRFFFNFKNLNLFFLFFIVFFVRLFIRVYWMQQKLKV